MLRSIVVGVDGAERGLDAVALAAALAAPGPTLHLACLHPYQPVSSRIEGTTFGAFTHAGAERHSGDGALLSRERVERGAAARRADVQRELSRLGAAALVELPRGAPADQIVTRTHRADLLVMGSRGHGPLKRLLLGGVAAQVVRHAGCPVIVIARTAVTSESGAGSEIEIVSAR